MIEANDYLLWLNEGFGSRFTQYCPRELEYLINPQLLKLIEKYGKAFDDMWFYWKIKPRKKAISYIKRRPIWMTQSKIPMEKPKLKYQGQKTLVESL